MNKAEKRRLLEKLTEEFLKSGGNIKKIEAGLTALAEDSSYWAGFTKDEKGESRWGHERSSSAAAQIDLDSQDEERRLTAWYGDIAHDDYSEDSFP